LNLYESDGGGQEDELYNLREDPWELNNRINDPACAGIAKTMQRELIDRVVRARKPIIMNHGGWHNHRYDLDGRIDLNHETAKPNSQW